QRSNVRMVQVRENLPLVPEATDGDIAFQATPQELDRNSLMIFVICPNTFVHGTHSAVSDEPRNLVLPNALAVLAGLVFEVESLGEQLAEWRPPGVPAALECAQQALNFLSERLIVSDRVRQELFSLELFPVESGVEQFAHAREPGGSELGL